MNTFAKKRIHAEILENLSDFILRLDEDLESDFTYHQDLLEQYEDEKDSYNYKSHKEKLEELNEKSNFLTKVIEYLEKMQL